MKQWFLQERGWELGNFVMATPALRGLSERMGKRVPVFFHTKDIGTLYAECPFIKVLSTKPKTVPVATTRCPKRRRNESDSQAYFRQIARKNPKRMGSTYVDSSITKVLEKEPGKKYVALFHGCYSNKLVHRKSVSPKVLRFAIGSIINRGAVPVILGNKKDFNRFWREVDLSQCMNLLNQLSLRDTVSILAQCDLFMSNDTGLYHVAGALDKKGLVMWTKTDPIKNKSPCRYITHTIDRMSKTKAFRRSIVRVLDKHI